MYFSKQVFAEGGAILSSVIRKNKYESYVNYKNKKRKIMGKGAINRESI